MRNKILLSVMLSVMLSVLSAADPNKSEALPLTFFQILIDVGHGGVDSGTTFGRLYEKDINLQVAKQLYQQLTAAGFDAAMNRSEDIALSEENRWLNNPSRHLRDLAQRRNLAKVIDPQLMISLHVNWSTDSRRRGPLVLYQSNEQSYMLAQLLQSSLNRYAGTNQKPQKGKTYYMLRHNYCPSVIVEMGFLSNAQDRAKLTNPEEQKKIAWAIREAVSEYVILTGEMMREEAVEEIEDSWWEELVDRLVKRF